MIVNDSLEHQFTFEFNGPNRTINYCHTFEEGVSWRDVHETFLDFLSSVYGYDIKKIVVEEVIE